MQKLKNNDDLIPVLNSAGIKAKEYSNKYVGVRGTFILGTSSGGREILVRNTPAAKIEVSTDGSKKQAVLNVTEEPIDVTKKVEVILSRAETNSPPFGTLASRLRNKFPVHIPGATLTVSKMKYNRRSINGEKRIVVTGNVRAKLGRIREMSFLVGMDETSHFISVLPKKAKTVEEAHKLLKPKDLPNVEGIKRQGEFFFVPTTNEIVETFLKQTGKGIRRSVPLEEDSNHIAQYAVPVQIRRISWYTIVPSQNARYQKGVHFVKGLIYDKRGYRHAPLELGDMWHIVMRNEEVKVPRVVARRYD